MLEEIILSASNDNFVVNQLINDYVLYHLVFVIIAILFLVLLVSAGIFFIKTFKGLPTVVSNGLLERRIYFCLSVGTIIATVCLLLVTTGNVTNLVNPQQGFSGAIKMLGSAETDTQKKLQQEFIIWIESESFDTPVFIQEKINQRLEWQKPKAIISSILLFTVVLLNIYIWRKLTLKLGDTGVIKDKKVKLILLIVGLMTIFACLVLMLLVIANTQAVFAPLLLTLLFG